MAMHKAVYPRYDIDYIYQEKRKKSPNNNEEILKASIQRLVDNITKSKEILITSSNCNSGNIK